MQTLVDGNEVVEAVLGTKRAKILPKLSPEQSVDFFEGALKLFFKQVNGVDLAGYLEYKSVEEHNPGSRARQLSDESIANARVAHLGDFMLNARVVKSWGKYSAEHVDSRVATKLFMTRVGKLLVVSRYRISVRETEMRSFHWLTREDLVELFEADEGLLALVLKELEVAVMHAKSAAQRRVNSLGDLQQEFVKAQFILSMTMK